MSPRLNPTSEYIRGARIGASEVAALLPGGHPYMTKGDVYARLVHGVRRPANALMEIGHELEPVALRLGAEKLGMKFRRNSRTWAHPKIPLAATPDAIRVGVNELAEVKIVTHWAAEDWQDGPPAHVMAQVQAQMLVTGRKRVHVIALVEGGPRVWTVDASTDEQFDIWDAVAAFHRDHLVPCRPPEDIPGELVLTVANVAGSMAADGDLRDYGDRLAELVAIKDEATERAEVARGELELAMAVAGASIVVGPSWIAEAKPVPSTGRVSLRFTRKRKGGTER